MKYNVKKIKTKNNCYLYDSATSNILDMENLSEDAVDEAFEAINNNHRLNTPAYREIAEAVQNGLIKAFDDSECVFWFDEETYFEDLKKRKHLLIGVTEKCNMRCKYCVYGGHYENERVHSDKVISYDTVVRAINLFLSDTASKHIIFNFYGGEPFTNFEVMKKSIEYVKKKEVDYSVVITTNGTLLNDEIIDWFIKNDNVHIYISLAGTRDTHDKLRVFKDGSTGTFAQIRKNVMRLKDKDNFKTAYPKRLHFVFNIFSETQLFEIRNFWNTEEMFFGIEDLPEITTIDCLQDDGTVSKLGEQLTGNTADSNNPLDEYIRLLKEKKYDDIFVNYYDNKFILVHKRDTENYDFKLSGVCRPFIHKYFVNTDGDINICENFILKNYFGNVHTKFNVHLIKQFLNKYKEVRKNMCRDCWAVKLCSLCFKDIFDTDLNINNKRALKMCNNERKLVEQLLTEYCTVLERDPDLLNHLDEQVLAE